MNEPLDVEQIARRMCAPMLSLMEKSPIGDLGESISIIAFVLGACWATGDAKLIQRAAEMMAKCNRDLKRREREA